MAVDGAGTLDGAMKPSEVKRNRDVLELERSIKTIGDYYMLINHDGSVCIRNHPNGETQIESIHLSRRIFQTMIEWYESDQTP